MSRIYVDISAAVHRRAGLGRYAESLARALLPILGDELAFFHNREAGIEPLAGLEAVPARTVGLGYKPWRMLVWLGQLAALGSTGSSRARSCSMPPSTSCCRCAGCRRCSPSTT